MGKTEAMIEKVKALINGPSCCAEAKEAANKWLEAVNTEKQDEAAKALIEEIAADIIPIDGYEPPSPEVPPVPVIFQGFLSAPPDTYSPQGSAPPPRLPASLPFLRQSSMLNDSALPQTKREVR